MCNVLLLLLSWFRKSVNRIMHLGKKQLWIYHKFYRRKQRQSRYNEEMLFCSTVTQRKAFSICQHMQQWKTCELVLWCDILKTSWNKQPTVTCLVSKREALNSSSAAAKKRPHRGVGLQIHDQHFNSSVLPETGSGTASPFINSSCKHKIMNCYYPVLLYISAWKITNKQIDTFQCLFHITACTMFQANKKTHAHLLLHYIKQWISIISKPICWPDCLLWGCWIRES